MTFKTKQDAEAFAKKCGVTGFAHESNRIGARGFIFVVLFEGKQYAIVNDAEMVPLSQW